MLNISPVRGIVMTLCLMPAPLLSADAAAQSVPPPCQTTVTGQIDLVPSISRVFHNQRYLRVWLPPGYSEPGNAGKRYPALYVMDGDNLFGDCPYGMQKPDWGIDETLTALIAKGAVPPMIVIGIDAVAREYELLPYRDPFFLQDAPEPIGRQFPDFLAQDIIPLVTKRYRIASGPQAIGGGPMGRLLHSGRLSRGPIFSTLACWKALRSASATVNYYATRTIYLSDQTRSSSGPATASFPPIKAIVAISTRSRFSNEISKQRYRTHLR